MKLFYGYRPNRRDLPGRPVSDTEMQQIANEIGFSEASFILSGKQPDGGYDVRIFTPAVEVPFAGRPTLGTAYVIQQCFKGGAVGEIRLEAVPIAAARILTENFPSELRQKSLKSVRIPALFFLARQKIFSPICTRRLLVQLLKFEGWADSGLCG